MKYAMADLHGEYERYTKMLKLIDFKDEDELYIIGDVIDRNEGGISILQDMMLRPNVFPIIGNHEYMMASCASFLLQEVTREAVENLSADMLQGFTEWMNVGGNATIGELSRLYSDEREAVIEYVEEFVPYEEVSAGGNEFVLVHAGLVDFDSRRSLDSYKIYEMIFKPPCYDRQYFSDRYLVTGHLPTRVIWADQDGKLTSEILRENCRDDIFMKNNHIAIDCGCGYDGRLGCICLDTFEEFYV